MQQPTWRQSDIFPLIARVIAAEYQQHQRFITAQEADASTPTYYGSAWVALGRVMLTSSALGSCPS